MAIALSIAIALLFLTVFGHYEVIQFVVYLRKHWGLITLSASLAYASATATRDRG